MALLAGLEQLRFGGRIDRRLAKEATVSRPEVHTRAHSPTRLPPQKTSRPGTGASPSSKPRKLGLQLPALFRGREASTATRDRAAREPNYGAELNWATNLADQYRIGRTVGHGAFGTVKLARSRSTGDLVAIKVLSKSRPGQSRQRTAGKLSREADCMAMVQECHGVVSLRGLFEDASSAYLVMDHCSGGDLEQLVQEEGLLSEHQAAVVLFEVLQVVAACHRRGVCHGDIKPANFLMSRKPASPIHSLKVGQLPLEGGWLKAIDFGCAQHIMGTKPLSRRTGTPVYMAPEVFVRNYSRPADMWSVGMLLYHTLSARFPFWETMGECKASSLEEVMEAVTSGEIVMDFGPFLEMSSEGLSLLRGLLVRDPSKRLSAEAALQHDWFKSHLGWEADKPRLLQTVLPNLVTAWAGASQGAPQPKAAAIDAALAASCAAAQPAGASSSVAAVPEEILVVLNPGSGIPAPRVVSPRPVRSPPRPKKRVSKAMRSGSMVANNVVPVSNKSGGANTSSGGGSSREARQRSVELQAAGSGC